MTNNMTSASTIRWGILGTGYISHEFARGLQSLPDAQLVAVGSRSLESAQSFARPWNIPQAYGSYAELVKDPRVDVVYIGTPNYRHRDDCLLCLEAGKPVLCEKPFTTNAKEAREVIEVARSRQIFCMEAMWMRFMPLVQKAQQMIQTGTLGEVCTFTADFGYPAFYDPQGRLFNLQIGGGALLDRGIYPLSLAFYLLGQPTQITGQATIGPTAVDEQSTYLLKYAGGQLASLSANLRTYGTNEAVITGTKGQIRLHAPFYKPHQMSVRSFSPVTAPPATGVAGSPGLKQKVLSNPLVQRLYLQVGDRLKTLLKDKSQTLFQPYTGNGYNYEAAEVMRCLRSGATESQVMPLDETLALMVAMDQLRQQWGLHYSAD